MTSTSTAAKKQAAEDDFGSQQKSNVRQPEVCVDYLSYKFDEMDLAASWRVMTKQKKDVVDGLRLENASWRTWAKQRNNLKTISPQTLNWLKDSDVTWLYGPLHTVIRTEEDPFLTPKKATTEETLGLIVNKNKPILKSALKKVTQVDLLKRSATELNLNEASNESLSVILDTYRQPRLRFNHQVEQCVALSNDHEDIIYEEEEEEDDNDYYHVQSIRKIEPARLKKSQSDGETTDDANSILSSSASSMGYMTRSPLVSSPILKPDDVDLDSEIEQDVKPVLQKSLFAQKSNLAEPALVTTHQTATDISSSSLFNNIANWATAYLWSNSKKK